MVKPKRPLSTWLIFNTAKVAELKENGFGHKDAFAESAKIWKGMSEKDKEPWDKKQKEDQNRYDA